MGVGMRLKSILRDKKMTIKQLSEKSGIPLNTLYSITKRDSLRVDRVILERISIALEVSVDDLLCKTDFSFPDLRGQTQTFQPFTKTDDELLKLGGFGVLAEFYNLPEDAQKEAMKDIHGFVEYTIAKYKKQSEIDEKGNTETTEGK